ncbi:MAG: sensor histidine kinase [Clostridia bacterium]|nr:sensor histidine kinase [Clostridia bacterium]
MDKNFKLSESRKHLVSSIKIVLISMLAIIEIIVCAQYATQYIEKGRTGDLIAVIISCVLLVTFASIDSFAVKNLVVKYVFFGFDSVCVLLLCVFTGNTYLSTLYCLVLTQIYISIDGLRENLILFSVSCALFIISFVCGRILGASGSTVYESLVEIIGDSILGVAILAVHFVVVSFILKFYSNNQQLRSALNEADESKAQLEQAYKEISRTAVYEERNRIAKDIHDNAGHSMTTVIMQTEAAKLLIDSDPEEAKNRIISANIQAKNALEQMRESVHLLAGKTDMHSLKGEIEEIIAQTIDGTELKIRCNIEDAELDGEKSRFICNSVKECLVNGIRHGRATAFFVEMRKEFSSITLRISDNGSGAEGEIKEGFGLRGIREKAEKLGGRCSFSSEAGEGFETEITIPEKTNKR